MNLTAAFQTARSALRLQSALSAVSSRNIAGSGDSSHSEKAVSWTSGPSGIHSVSVERSFDRRLQQNLHTSIARVGYSNEVSLAYDRINVAVSTEDSEHSIPAIIGKFKDALQAAMIQPDNQVVLASVVDSAKALAQSMRTAQRALETVRLDADRTIRDSVGVINRKLSDLHEVEQSIIVTQGTGGDTTSLLDMRDAILNQLSEEIGVCVVDGDDGTVSVYAVGGAVLYNRGAREVSLREMVDMNGDVLAAPVVLVDGADISSANSTMRGGGGRLLGAIDVRDNITTKHLSQLSELGRALVSTFVESPVTSTGSGGLPGLFVFDEAVDIGMPGAPGNVRSGIAVNPNVDPIMGGDPKRLRDGGISRPGDPLFVSNPQGYSGYTARIEGLLSSLNKTQTFEADASLGNAASIEEYSIGLVAFAAARRNEAAAEVDQSQAIKEQFSAAFGERISVSLDKEMSKLLVIENNYRASAKIISVVDGLYDALFASMR